MKHTSTDPRRRGSILDLFLILLLLACVLGVLLRWQELKKSDADPAVATYALTLRYEKVTPQTVDCLHVGDALYCADGTFFGTVKGIATAPTAVTLIEDGTVYTGEWEPSLYVDLTVTVEATGSMRETTFLHGGRIPMSVGERVALHSELVSLSFKLYKLSPEKG